VYKLEFALSSEQQAKRLIFLTAFWANYPRVLSYFTTISDGDAGLKRFAGRGGSGGRPCCSSMQFVII
jgi:hypothetical protein